jgi:hypothetical protein
MIQCAAGGISECAAALANDTHLKNELARWARVVKDSGIKAD